MNLYKYIVHTHREYREPTQEQFECFAESVEDARKLITEHQCWIFDWKRWYHRSGMWYKKSECGTYRITLYPETIYTPEQAREINRQEAGGSSFLRRLLNQ